MIDWGMGQDVRRQVLRRGRTVQFAFGQCSIEICDAALRSTVAPGSHVGVVVTSDHQVGVSELRRDSLPLEALLLNDAVMLVPIAHAPIAFPRQNRPID